MALLDRLVYIPEAMHDAPLASYGADLLDSPPPPKISPILEIEPRFELDPLRRTVLILWMYLEKPSDRSREERLGSGLDMIAINAVLSLLRKKFVQIENYHPDSDRRCTDGRSCVAVSADSVDLPVGDRPM